jgi:H+/gluconate symporter-like permease
MPKTQGELKMLMIFLLIAISGLITFLTYKYDRRNTTFAAIFTNAISAVVIIITIVASYVSYLDIGKSYLY